MTRRRGVKWSMMRRKAVSARLRGRKHPHRGVRKTAAQRKALSARMRGRKHPHRGVHVKHRMRHPRRRGYHLTHPRRRATVRHPRRRGYHLKHPRKRGYHLKHPRRKAAARHPRNRRTVRVKHTARHVRVIRAHKVRRPHDRGPKHTTTPVRHTPRRTTAAIKRTPHVKAVNYHTRHTRITAHRAAITHRRKKR